MELIKRGKVWHYDHLWGMTRLRGSTGKTDKYLARIFAEEEIKRITTRGVNIKNNDFGKFVEKYWENQTPYNRPRTIVVKKIALNHFIAFANPKSVSDVDVLTCQSFLSSYLIGEKKMKPISANTTVRMLRQVFNSAERWGYNERNPFNKIQLLKYQEEEAKVLTPEEIKRLLTYVSKRCPRYYDLFFFYLLTGMRMMEPFKLDWENIDFEGKMIAVTWTKTKYNRRIVMLPPVEEMLRERKKRGEKKPFDIYYKNATNMLEKIRVEKDLDIPWVSIKVFRRCTTSYLRSVGVSEIIIEKIMGHSKAVALRNYFSMPNQELIDQIAPLQNLLPKYAPPMSHLCHNLDSEPVPAEKGNKKRLKLVI